MKIIKGDKWVGLSILIIKIIQVILLSKDIENNSFNYTDSFKSYTGLFVIIMIVEYILFTVYLSISRKISSKHASTTAGLILSVLYFIMVIIIFIIE